MNWTDTLIGWWLPMPQLSSAAHSANQRDIDAPAERNQTSPTQWTPVFGFEEVIIARAAGVRVVYGAAEFRARLRAASFSRVEMATVMVETLRDLGYDVSAWDTAKFTDRDRCPHCDEKL